MSGFSVGGPLPRLGPWAGAVLQPSPKPRASRGRLSEPESPNSTSPCPNRLPSGFAGREPDGRALRNATQDCSRISSACSSPSPAETPKSPLLWTSKSTRHLAEELVARGHQVSHDTVGRLLDEIGYSLQANRKTLEGKDHPDRDAQFGYINRQVRAFQRAGQPVISVDAKKKELVGNFRNLGREWHRRGEPQPVRAKDFPDKQLGKAIPEGVYDLSRNEGWVSVGVDHDTSEFAVASIRRWWEEMGSPVYPRASRLLITADAGGSNGYRSRLWKVVLQDLATELGLRITVCHFPPGTSKWNKIEHRMFSYITKNWRGRPLVSRAVIVNLIGQVRTQEGLRIKAELDPNVYPEGIKVSDAELARVRLQRAKFHGDWNYTILPDDTLN